MQKYPVDLSEDERRMARRLAGLYGSILAGLVLYAAFSHGPVANLAASGLASKASAAHAPQELASRQLPR
jgi:hypothetical protein